jgi:acetyl esterase/lipase
VFFSKGVSLAFIRFRLLRHGYLRSPVPWREVSTNGIHGLYLIGDANRQPDVIVYYCHGGGFSMGSAYFYLEPLIALLALLSAHYTNPAVFALEYTLVPDATYPKQLEEVVAGYDHVLKLIENESSRVVVAGDSAGATLILSLLLHVAKASNYKKRRPGYATLISPWVTLIGSGNRDTKSDYLSKDSLHLYGTQYAGTYQNLLDPLVSPGCCTDLDWWVRASPIHGFYIAYGSEEVLGPETRELVDKLRSRNIHVTVTEQEKGIHAWVIASLFLEENFNARIKGMRELVTNIAANITPTRSSGM